MFSHEIMSNSLWTAACQASLSFTIYLLEFAHTHVHWVNDAIQPSVAPSPALNLSRHQDLFHWASSVHQMAKVLEFQFQHLSFNEYSGLISFRNDWFYLLAAQKTLKSLLQHHSLKSSTLWHSAIFMVQLSHPYMTTGKSIALTIWIFVSNVISLLLNAVSKLVMDFIPRNKPLLILWL